MGDARSWVEAFSSTLARVVVTDEERPRCQYGLNTGIKLLLRTLRGASRRGGRVVLLGNGGSLAAAMHIATDYALAGWPALALSDVVAATSHTNDFGRDATFSRQLGYLKIAKPDVVIALSTSGTSQNVLEAARVARVAGCSIVSLSGCRNSNPLRRGGGLAFWVPSRHVGVIQLAHEAILHMACDFETGKNP